MRASSGKKCKIKVFLVDDHPIVREGVRTYLGAHGIEVVGEASDAKEALRKIKRSGAEVVVLDVNLPVVDGGELARSLRRLQPQLKLIAFSIHSSEEYVVRMARCGVQGYVTKAQPPDDLLTAIRDVFKGELHFPAGMNDALLAAPPVTVTPPGAAALTSREKEVLVLLAEGFPNKGVAARLGISVRTAETHRENLTRKLGILTVAGLTKYALKNGLTVL